MNNTLRGIFWLRYKENSSLEIRNSIRNISRSNKLYGYELKIFANDHKGCDVICYLAEYKATHN